MIIFSMDKVSKHAPKYLKVYYTHCIPPTCFVHSYDLLQGDALQRIDILKYYRNVSTNAQI